ncbi:MAG: hypothetical protein ACHWZW_15325 [Spirulina sp.]
MIGPLPTAIANTDAPALGGQVEVAEGVALGDSVVLNAAPGCRLVLAPGVCVGSGVIIQAVRGDVVIEPGAVLGSGVLIFGTGRIGQNACIGAESTLINPAIPSGQVVPPNSLLGDPSRPSANSANSDLSALVQGTFVQETLTQGRVVQSNTPLANIETSETGASETGFLGQAQSPEQPSEPSPQAVSTTADDHQGAVSSPAQADGSVIPEATSDAMESDAAAVNGTRPAPAHGQKQVQDLLAKLFPHRQPLNGVTSGGVSSEDRP